MHDQLFLFIDISIILLLGLCLGSFATALVYRIPRGLPVIKTRQGAFERSVCVHCRTQLKSLDLIPILSWCFQKGRCRYCQNNISRIYPLIEVTTVISCFCVYGFLGFSAAGIALLIATPILIALLFIDFEHLILPNQLVFTCLMIGFVYLLYQAFWLSALELDVLLIQHILGAVIYGVTVLAIGWAMGKILKKETLGLGDVKFFAVAGLWLGLGAFPIFCILSGLAGVIVALLWKLVKRDSVFPFGPALIVAFYVLFITQNMMPLSFFGSSFFL